MTIDLLYEMARAKGIHIHNYRFNKLVSMSTVDNIGIDKRKIKTSREHKTIIAHEIGHCTTGSFYNLKSKFETIERMEYRANRWAVEQLIPFDKYYQALTAGITEIWQLAEHFEVTEEFMQKTAQLYEAKVLEHYEKQNDAG